MIFLWELFFLSIAYICRFSSEQTFLRCVICCHSRAWNDENEKKKERKEHATKKKQIVFQCIIYDPKSKNLINIQQRERVRAREQCECVAARK